LQVFFEEGSRIEAGFRRYIHREEVQSSDEEEKKKKKTDTAVETPPSSAPATIDILVCHGNVIRYFLCRALQFPPDAWLRHEIYNGSISHLYVRPSGRVGVQTIGDTGYMPKDKLSFN
jgi:serine/threonine-protein phosphatase PGAM5